MKDYKRFTMTKPCDVCPTLSQSEAYSRAYRRVANDAINYLLDVYHRQRGGQLAEIDCERVVDLLDTLLSIENDAKGGNDNGTELQNDNGN